MKIIKFTKYANLTFISSFVIIICFCIYTFLSGGFNMGVDFQSGLNVEIRLAENGTKVNLEDLYTLLKEKNISSFPREIGASDVPIFSFTLKDDRKPEFETRAIKTLIDALSTKYPNATVQSKYYVDSKFSSKLVWQMATLSVLSILIIMAYLAFRFKFKYAISAVVALMHDVLLVLFIVGAFKIEFNVSTMAAILTIIGYSLNDTIVVFDRIRENESRGEIRGFKDLIDLSVTQSLSRTLITSLTTLFSILALLFFTTDQVRDFSLVLTLGIVIGTYSSIYVASIFLLYLNSNRIPKGEKSQENIAEEKVEAAKEKEYFIDFEAEKKKLQEKIKNKRKK